jgi:hypothetical protein
MPIPQKRNQNTEKVQFQVREFQYFFCSFTNKDMFSAIVDDQREESRDIVSVYRFKNRLERKQFAAYHCRLLIAGQFK